MIKRFYFAALAAAALVGCNEKMAEMPENASESVQLTVSVPVVSTKVMSTPPEDGVETLQILVFNEYGLMEHTEYKTGSSITMTCTTGDKTIAAIVNAPKETDVLTLDELKERTFDLNVLTSETLVMFGTKDVTLSANSEVEVPVTRIPARVVLSSVTFDLQLAQPEKVSFYINAVYLINVAANASFGGGWTPNDWYHLGRYNENRTLDFRYDSVAGAAAPTALSDTYETPHYFYCLPNKTETKTRLVIEVMIAGEIYYYPITLDKVESNKSYSYNVTLNHLGTDSPDKPLEFGRATFTVDVKPWEVLDTEDVVL